MTSRNRKTTQPTICLTLDLEEDHAGQIFDRFEALTHPQNAAFISFLKANDIPVSVFIQGKLFAPPHNAFITRLKNELAPDLVEFFLHAHSHEFRLADAGSNIVTGKRSFERFFGYPPIGYRAPEGRITPAGIKRLQHNGFVFDSSLFPSVLPKPSAFLKQFSIMRHAHKNNFREIPVTTVPGSLFPLTLSWIKCVGWPFFSFCLSRRIKTRPLQTMVFAFHLHDLWYLKSTAALSPFWRCVYARNRRHGFDLFTTFVHFARSKNMTFKLLSSAFTIKE